jgi:UDP-3-O-[3-hydroxymyristoyl] N-acetylglucosamine deacetylase
MLMQHDTDSLKDFHQNTLSQSIDCLGTALHSGEKISMKLCPAEADTGIVFVRTDLSKNNVIPAKWDHVVDTKLCTVIANQQGASVATIEHLMAAFKGMNIDNARVEIDGAEVPVMDGSSAMFIFLIECAGIKVQDKTRKYIKILKEVQVDRDDASAKISPSDQEKFSYDLKYHDDAIKAQHFEVTLQDGIFKAELSRARTYGFLKDVDMMRKAGLALGGSLNNAVVIEEGEIVNEGGLRYTNEFVRHKTLDAVGDLYLSGHPILGSFQGDRSGHEMNNKLLREVFSSDANWRFVEVDELMANPALAQRSPDLEKVAS